MPHSKNSSSSTVSRSKAKSPLPFLFCGAFASPENGTVGGVLYACTSFLSSATAQKFDWAKIDSTQPLPPHPFLTRAINATKRLLQSTWQIVLNRIDGTLIFTSFRTMSLLEKISIAIVSGLCGKPTVITFRSEIVHLGRNHWFMSSFVNFGLKRVTAIVCQSQEAKLALQTIFPGHELKIHVIPNWIEPHTNTLSIRPTSDLPIRATFIGWLEPNKDVETILRAFHSLNREFSNWQLSICGNGSQANMLQELTIEFGFDEKVNFTGWIGPTQKDQILQNTDLFIMASLSEGMPNSIVEAMNYGIPVVATSVGGIPSLVKHGTNGYLVPAGDQQKMAEFLLELMTCPETRTRISQANTEKIREQHNVEVAAARIINLLTFKTLI